MKVAVIPARGGSKRIPQKNIKDFCGMPIIAYSIEAAKRSGLFDRVVVSTDCEKIAEVAIKFGADVPFFRPSELADDHTILLEAVAHCVKRLELRDESQSQICCLFATAPMIESSSLVAGYELLRELGRGLVMSVAEFAYPIQRALSLDELGRVQMIQPQYALTRSQDLNPCYHDAAQFIWGSASAFLNYKHENTHGIRVDRATVQDIDTMEDWAFAETLYQARHKTRVTKV